MTMTEVPREPRTAAHQVRADAVGIDQHYWRITASNGRTVARSAGSFTTTAEALDALEALAAATASRRIPGSVGHRPGGWGWTVTDPAGNPAAQSARSFDRHGSCVRSLERFRDVLAQLGDR